MYRKLPSKRSHPSKPPFSSKIVYRVSYTPHKRPLKHGTLHRLRTCIASVAHVQMAKRHASYDVAFKCSAITWHRQHGRNVLKTAREFEVDRKRIREWNSKYENLMKLNHGTSKKKRKIHLGAAVASQDLDSRVFSYLENQRSEGFSVSNKELRAFAKEGVGGLGLSHFAASP